MARKFQIGDIVEVVAGAWVASFFKVGHRGKIMRYASGELFPYKIERRNGIGYCFNARELKLIKRGTK